MCPTACKIGSGHEHVDDPRAATTTPAPTSSLASTQFGCVGPPGPTTKKDNYWCPTTRKSALQSTNGNGPPDYVGVYVEGTHRNLIGLFGKTFTFSNDTVIRIEPRTLR